MTIEAQPDSVEGVVEHVVYVSYNERTVLRLATVSGDHEQSQVTAYGMALFGARPGESLRLQGKWTRHPQYGRQFQAMECERTVPATEAAIRIYLSSGLIRGIGPKRAAVIVDQFGERTLEVLSDDPYRLTEIAGIGEKLLASIMAAWAEHRAIAEIMVFLQGLGISPILAVKIYTTYKDQDVDPLEVVRRTPYQLCRDIRGVGFKNADKIALAAGVPKHSDQRLQAAMFHVLGETTGSGHCFTAVSQLLAKTRELLDDGDPAMFEVLEDAVLRCALEALRAQGEVVTEIVHIPDADGGSAHHSREVAALDRLHRAESGAALQVRRLTQASSLLSRTSPWEEQLDALTGSDRAGLSQEQRSAVVTALTNNLSVLTGGPGCGKTHTLRMLVELAQNEGAVVALAAPTGKAAKRLAETTGQDAMTVHRLIRQETGDSLFDHASLLESADLVIVDEASMLDIELAHRLLAAVPSGCHLLLVGDIDQLPSIGPGRVLRDLLAFDTIPRTRLTRVFRQDKGSGAIVHAARKILAGEIPTRTPGVFGIEYNTDREKLANRAVQLVTQTIPEHYNVTAEGIQVLSPSRRHAAGVIDLNQRLQNVLNPPAANKPEHHGNGVSYRLGDRVLQIRNNRDRGTDGVFNGATGTITKVDTEDHQLVVTFTDGDVAEYSFADLDEILHSYALTVHRSQGSEYPFVVITLTNAAHFLLHRNLLYTAVTRAQRGVVVLGQSEAVVRAVETLTTTRRRTLLTHRLEHGTVILPGPRRSGKDAHGQLTWE
ncbi:SF1B family DNA helicase RecD2 [Streptomyces niveus]